MRAAVFILLPRGSSRSKKSRMAAHDDAYIDARQGAKIEIDAHKCAGNEFSGRYEPWRVIILDEVIVDRLGRVHKGDIAAGRIGEYLLGPGRIISADVNGTPSLPFRGGP